MPPTFSIIIPVYNVAPYLRECLDSVLAAARTLSEKCEVRSEKCGGVEIICVDDGSTDGSGSILDEYAKLDSRFRVVHKNNEGVSVARNVGIEMALGAYVGFVDADDVLLPRWLEAAAECAERANVDMIRMGHVYWDSPNRPVDTAPMAWRMLSGHERVLEWGWPTLMAGGWSWALFVRADIAKHPEVRFPAGMRMKEDNVFCLRLLNHVSRVVLCEYDGYLYRNRPGSVVNSKRDVEDHVRFFEEVIDCVLRVDALAKKKLATVMGQCVSNALMRDVEEYCRFRSVCECGANRRLFDAFREARRIGVLRLRFLQRNLKMGYVGLLASRLFVFVKVNTKIVELYGKIRSIARFV